MLKSILSSPQVAVLEGSLAAASLRHKVISNNIANVNTPGFKRSEVLFEQQLRETVANSKLPLAATHRQHLAGHAKTTGAPLIQTLSNFSLRTDGNNVDIDTEMAELAKNSIYYDAVAQQIGRYFSNLKSAINEGRR